MRFLDILFAILISVPVVKIFMDLMTDSGGLIQNVTANTSVNGSATTAWGQQALTIWQFFPYLCWIAMVLALYKYAGGKLNEYKGNKQGPMR